RIVSVGRITPIKRLEILLDALALLRTEGVRAEVSLVGAPTVPSDAAYQESLAAQASRFGISGAVHFMGAMPYDAMPEHYRQNDISVNLAPTGGIDTAVLEAMASGCIPLVANRAFAPFFKSDADRLLFDPNPEALAEKLRSLIRMQQEERRALAARLSATARTEADERVIVARLYSLLLP
ncbi:MAG TPA: glycosyltransferase family 4 protein, partial [Candidatus Paceibacterota bacterium]|nr:glycosyltransferase family 4 protein [Candidatus Paceibacterota bacterium]